MSAVVALGVLFAACSNDSESASTTTTAAGQARGGLTIFAATSLTAAFTDVAEAFTEKNPDAKITFNFAASSALVQQLSEGAKADVVAAADTATTDKVATLIDPPVVFARNQLAIVTKPGNPRGVNALAGLRSLGVVALCGAEVPCGKYAGEALAKAKVTIAESKITRGQNVAATLAAVTEGDADAGIVYITDAAAAGAKATLVAIPAAQNVEAAYPIARVKAAANPSAARAFIAFVRSAAGQKILGKYGFLAP